MSALVDVPVPSPAPPVEPATESVPETTTVTEQVEEEAPVMVGPFFYVLTCVARNADQDARCTT